jgi:hypothetical protein
MINDQQPKRTLPAQFVIEKNDKAKNKTDWDEWKKQFESYIEDAGIVKESRKLSAFLVAVGQETEDIYNKVAKDDDKYEDIIKALDGQFETPTTSN